MVDMVKEPKNVEIDNPVVAPTSLARHANRFNRRFPRALPVRVFVKMLL